MADSNDKNYKISFSSDISNTSSTTKKSTDGPSVVKQNSNQQATILSKLVKEIATATYNATLKGIKDGAQKPIGTGSGTTGGVITDVAMKVLFKKLEGLLSKDTAGPNGPKQTASSRAKGTPLTYENFKKLADSYFKGPKDGLNKGLTEDGLARVIKELINKSAPDSKARDIESSLTKIANSSYAVADALEKAKGLSSSGGSLDILKEGKEFISIFNEVAKDLKAISTASKDLKETVKTLPAAAKKSLGELGPKATALRTNLVGRAGKIRKEIDINALLKSAVQAIVAEMRKVSPEMATTSKFKALEHFDGNAADLSKLVIEMKDVNSSFDGLKDQNKQALVKISKFTTDLEKTFSNMPDMSPAVVPGSRSQWPSFAKDLNVVKKTVKDLVGKLTLDASVVETYLKENHFISVDLLIGENKIPEVLDTLSNTSLDIDLNVSKHSLDELKNVVKDIEDVVISLVTELKKVESIKISGYDSGTANFKVDKSKELIASLTDSKGNAEVLAAIAKKELSGTDPTRSLYYEKTPAVREKMQKLKETTQPYNPEAIEKVRKELKTVSNDVKTVSKEVKDLKDTSTSVTENKYAGIKDLTKFGLNKQSKVYSYPEQNLPQDRSFNIPSKGKLPSAAESHAIVNENVNTLTNSLMDLQQYIIKTLEKGFSKDDSGWAIVRKSADENMANYFKVSEGLNKKTAGKQYSLKIADVGGLQSATGSNIADPISLIKTFKTQVKKELLDENKGHLAEEIGNWVKRLSKDDIANWKGSNKSITDELVRLKKLDTGRGSAPSAKLMKALSTKGEGELKPIYAATVGEVVANERLTTKQKNRFGKKNISPYVRDVAIPAAKLTPSGANIFETQNGSQRVIPKFATYKTGFENLYEKLSGTKSFDVKKEYHQKIRETSIRPKGTEFKEVNKLANAMLVDYGKASPDELVSQYEKAAVLRGNTLEKQKKIGKDEGPKFANDIKNILKTEFSGAFDVQNLIDRMAKKNVAAYDVTKSMESVEFKDIYKVFKDLLEKSGAVEDLANTPEFGSNIRDQEVMLRKIVGKIPIADPSRPRRYAHQEKIVNLMSMTNPDIYSQKGKEGTKGWSSEEQKQYIRDLNLNLRDFVKGAKVLTSAGIKDRKIPLDVKTLTSLGVPESTASKLDEFRVGNHDPETKSLAPFKATVLKMYSDSLPDYAPFGQFQQPGRNIAGITNAMAYRRAGATIGTDFPELRSKKEDEIISGGRHGTQGYGFNVIAEMRNTTSNFEDQIVISGKLANVLTSVTKNLIKPDQLGKLDLFSSSGKMTKPNDLSVDNIKKHTLVGSDERKTLLDSREGIEKANRVIQEVLGVKDEYKGRADEALIAEVTKALTVVRGQELNVQVAKLIETFFNAYGRKFTTRYQSKGVAITAGGGHELTGKQVAERFQGKKISVIPEDERGNAGLGSAIMPKSMGALMAEVLTANVDKLNIPPGAVKTLNQKLKDSGNKFMIDMFTNKDMGIVPAAEAEIQDALYKQISYVVNSLGLKLKQGVEGIEDFQTFYKEQAKINKDISGKTYEEEPIDIRFNSYSMGKRGLQTEALETIMGNVANVGEKGSTVLNTNFEQSAYERMLEDPKEGLSAYSKALGFKRQTPNISLEKDMIALLKDNKITEKDPNFEKQLKELMSLESNSYYSDIIDEFGDTRKSLVGPKFVEILEDPHANPPWSEKDIEKQIKGEKLNLPAFGAYTAIFGENSDFIKQMSAAIPLESKKHWEFIKALQALNKNRTDMAEQLLSSARKIDVSKLASFTDSTGTFGDEGSMTGTILDTEMYPEALNLQIPNTAKPQERQSFYVPNALTRVTYPEPTMAGEYGMDNVSRRLQNIVNASEKVDAEVDKIKKSGSTLTFETVGRIIKNLGEYRKKADTIVGDDPNKELDSKQETALRAIFDNMQRLLKGWDVDPRLTYGNIAADEKSLTQNAGYVFQSRAEYMEEFLQTKLSKQPRGIAYKTAIGQQVDQIIGPDGKAEDEPNQAFKERYDKDASIVGLLEMQENQKGLEAASNMMRITPPKESGKLEKSLKSLEKAKIEYYNAIANTVLGKKGSVQELIFSRKIPAVMAKAINATVDKTDDLKQFSKDLKSIYASASGLGIEGISALEGIAEDTDVLQLEHADRIAKHKKKGYPVLKQHELGIPEQFAENLPAHFKKKFNVSSSGKLTRYAEEKDYDKGTNLKELLQYRKALEEGKNQPDLDSMDRVAIENDLKSKLTPYIESVRFPFTGTSSVQPYEAKLLSPEPGKRQMEKHTLVAPGIPDMDFKEFDKIKTKAEEILYGKFDKEDPEREIKQGLVGALEAERADENPDPNRIAQLTKTIDALDRAISAVIPKYIAHQQKLDFDGDMIEVHSAKTKEARQEIEQHFKSLTDYDAFKGTTAQVYRNAFTYDAITPSTGNYPLAEQQLAFQKKFSSEEGNRFLHKPFLTEDMEFLSAKEQLDALATVPGEGGTPRGPANAITGILPELYRDNSQIDKIVSAMGGVAPPEDKAGEAAYSQALLNAIESLDATIYEVVTQGIKTKLSDTKYLTAVNAQLFKSNTGPDTEALNRLLKLFERNVGFGGGTSRISGEYNFSPQLAKRMPTDLNTLGSTMGEELTTMMNEFVRVAFQKGMDVKHAGEVPIAAEIATLLASGPIGVEKLIGKIQNKEGSYKDYNEFAAENAKALTRNFANVSTEGLRSDAVKLAKGRGQNVQQFAQKDREELKGYIGEQVGFEGFLRELGTQIVEAAYEGIKEDAARVKDPSSVMTKADIDKRIKSGLPLDIKKTVENPLTPLYKYRTYGASGYDQTTQYNRKYPKIQSPELDPFFNKTDDYDKGMRAKYNNAMAVSSNLQDDLIGFVNSEREKRGSYDMMALSTIDNLKNDQLRIDKLNVSMAGEGDRMSSSIEDRLDKTAPMHSATKALLDISSSKERFALLEEDTKAVGAPSFGTKQKQTLQHRFLAPAGAYAAANVEKNLLPEDDYKDEDAYIEAYIKEEEKLKQEYLNKAYAVYQSDMVLKVAKAGKGGGKFLKALLPEAPSSTGERYNAERKRQAQNREDQLDMNADQYGQTMTDPSQPPTGGAGSLYKGASSGGVVDVRLVDLSGEMSSFFANSGSILSDARTMAQTTPYTDPQKSIDKDLIEDIKQAKKVSSLLSMGVNDPRNQDSDYGLKYRASGLKGVGSDSTADKNKQIKKIAAAMMGKEDKTDILSSTSLLGTAIHAQLEDVYKNDKATYEAPSGASYTDVTRGESTPFVTKQYQTGIEIPISPKYIDPIAGEISGTMDVVRRKEDGTVGEIIDIKTTNATNFKNLQEALRLIGKKEASFEEVRGKLAPTPFRNTKLDEVLSQLNFYLKATNEAAKASAHFYSNVDTDLRNPVKLTTTFDPERYERDMKAVAAARQKVKDTGGEFAPTASYERAQELHAQKPNVSDDDVNKLLDTATKYYKAITSNTDKRRYLDLQSSDRTFLPGDHANLNKKGQKNTGVYKEWAAMLKAHPVPEGPEAASIAKNLIHMQLSAKEYARDNQGVDIEGPSMQKFHPLIQKFVKDTVTGGAKGMEFSELLSNLKTTVTEDGTAGIESKDINKAWRAYRIALGDYHVNLIEKAEKDIDNAESGSTTQFNALRRFQSQVSDFQRRIKSDLGKKTDIYTSDHRYNAPESAKAAGVFLEKPELVKKASQPIGEDDRLEDAFKRLTDVDRELMPIPRDAIREALTTVTQLDKGIVQLYTDGDKVAVMGDKINDAFDFTSMRRSLSRLRAALDLQLSFNTKDLYDPEQIAYLERVLKELKSLESVYINLDLEGTAPSDAAGGYKFPTLIDVPKQFSRDEQEALHIRNLQKLREYMATPENKGGARKGDVIPYAKKTFGPNNRVITNQSYVFQKYGDTFDTSGEKVGVFKERFKDLNKIVGEGNRTFSVAIERVVKWGAAATVVYGGMSYMKDAVDHISEVEMAMARLQMVMNPLSTDFDGLRKSAIGFAKQYGVETTDVLQSMRVFAQQGLGQEEVVDRTQTSTLAANVTTLSATDATEALTASMKVFRAEGEDSMRFLDAWSEVEAKAAITAGDLADAIKKAASAGKNAGFTFDQLNGMVAAIGSTTRQTGKEVGTSLRFIFRRLTSEKGPKELAKLNIPIVGEEGQLRPGFDVLSDLSESWDDLGNSQKMAIAQAIGGTRQYNSVLTLMDNWDEVTRSLTNSINSKGSAERRNLELMKTYAKQLEQTKASASELKIEVGKLILPTFKAGLSGMRTFLEVVNAIPAPIKLAAAGLTTFFAFAAKGAPLIEGLASSMMKGKLMFRELGDDFKKGIKIGGYESLGIGDPLSSNVLEGLSTMGDPGVKGQEAFHSALGKTGYLLTDLSKKYNTFLGTAVKTPADMAAKVSGTLKDALQGIDNAIDYGQVLGLSNNGTGPLGWVDEIASNITEAGVKGAKGLASLSETGTKYLGKEAGKFIDYFAADNAGLIKAVTPLAITGIGIGAAAGPMFKEIKSYLATAEQYRDEQYKSIALEEKQVQSIRNVQSEYESYGKSKKSIDANAKDPKARATALSLDTYKSPILETIKLQSKLRESNNSLSGIGPNLIGGYDQFGNAVAGVTTNLEGYLDVLERSKVKSLALKRVDVAGRFIKDVTATGGSEKVKEELKSLASEFPLIGELIASSISVSTKQAIATVGKELNKLVVARNANPLSQAFDKDINKLEESLASLRGNFRSSVKEINKTLSDIDLKGLSPQDIADVFSSPILTEGYEMTLEYDVKYNTSFTKGKADVGDLIGQRVLSGLRPEAAGIIEAIPELTYEKAKELKIKPQTQENSEETLGSKVRNVLSFGLADNYSKAAARTGDLAILTEKFAKEYDVAGRQALITVKDTDSLMLEYFDKRENKLVSLDVSTGDISPFVQAIIPVQRIITETEDQLAQLHAFVIGAEAGLTSMSPKTLKGRNLDLGGRFYSDIATSSLVQSSSGYNPMSDTIGKIDSKSNYAEDFRKYLSDPMTEYTSKLEQLRTLTYEGIESSDVKLVGALKEELAGMQDVLKNNQVVFQYRAAHEDLNKTLEAGSRTLKQNIALERDRIESNTYRSGYLKGASKELESVELGNYNPTELSSQQRLLKESPTFAETSKYVKFFDTVLADMNESIASIEKTKVDIHAISNLNKGFGNVIPEKDRKKFLALSETGASIIEAKLVLQNDAMLKEEQMMNQSLKEIVNLMKSPGDAADSLGREITGQLDKVSSLNPLPISIFKNFGALAQTRDRAIGQQDYELAAKVDQLMNSLAAQTVATLGVGKTFNTLKAANVLNAVSPFEQATSLPEFMGRALAGANINVEQFIDQVDKEKSTGFFASKPIRETKEYDTWKRISDNNSKEPLVSSKNIVKTSVALAIMTQFAKLTEGSKSASLAAEIKRLEKDKGSALDAGIPVDLITKELIATRIAYEKSNKMSSIYGVTQAASGIVGGSALVAQNLGFTDTGVKGTAATALATYGMIKMLSKSVGQDLPTYVKEFGDNIKPYSEKFMKGEDLGLFEKLGFKKLVDKFMDTYKEQSTQATGQSGEDVAAAAKKEYDSNTTKTARELDKLSKDAYDKASAKIDQRTLTLLRTLILGLGTASAGYIAKQPDTRFNSLDSKAIKETEAFNKIINKNARYVDAAFEGIAKENKPGLLPKKIDKTYESKILDPNEEKAKQLLRLEEKANSFKRKRNDLLEAQQEELASLDAQKIVKDSIMELEKYILSIKDSFAEFVVNRRLSGPLTTSGSLRSYPGDMALPINTREMSTQQRAYKEGKNDEGFLTKFIGTFQDAYVNRVAGNSSMSQDTSEYFDMFANLNQQQSSLQGMAQTAAKEIVRLETIINTPGQDKAVKKSATKARDDLIEAYDEIVSETDEVAEHLEGLGTTLKNMLAYKEAVYQLNDSLKDLQIQTTVDGFKDMKEYLDDINRLVGGSRPDAALEISPEQERLGLRTGVFLENRKSTQFDLEKAQLLDSVYKGEGGIDTFYKLAEFEQTKQRKLDNYEARKSDDDLRNQTLPFKEFVTNLERVRNSETIDAGYGLLDKLNPFTTRPSDQIGETIEAVNKSLAAATDEVPVSQILQELKTALRTGKITENEYDTEVKKYKGKEPYDKVMQGMSLMDRKKFSEDSSLYNEAVKDAFKAAPTADMQKMEAVVTDPITQRLDISNQLLGEMLKDSAGFSSKDIEEVFSGTYSDNIFEKIYKTFTQKADGGRIFGAGGPRDDKVPAYLSPGEFVIRQKAAADIGYANLEKMNQGGNIPKFADGGAVSKKIVYPSSDSSPYSKMKDWYSGVIDKFHSGEAKYDPFDTGKAYKRSIDFKKDIKGAHKKYKDNPDSDTLQGLRKIIPPTVGILSRSNAALALPLVLGESLTSKATDYFKDSSITSELNRKKAEDAIGDSSKHPVTRALSVPAAWGYGMNEAASSVLSGGASLLNKMFSPIESMKGLSESGSKINEITSDLAGPLTYAGANLKDLLSDRSEEKASIFAEKMEKHQTAKNTIKNSIVGGIKEFSADPFDPDLITTALLGYKGLSTFTNFAATPANMASGTAARASILEGITRKRKNPLHKFAEGGEVELSALDRLKEKVGVVYGESDEQRPITIREREEKEESVFDKIKRTYTEWVESKQPGTKDVLSIGSALGATRKRKEALDEVANFAGGGRILKFGDGTAKMTLRERIANIGTASSIDTEGFERLKSEGMGYAYGKENKAESYKYTSSEPENERTLLQRAKDSIMGFGAVNTSKNKQEERSGGFGDDIGRIKIKLPSKRKKKKSFWKRVADYGAVDYLERDREKYADGGMMGGPGWLEEFKKSSEKFKEEQWAGDALKKIESVKSFTGNSEGISQINGRSLETKGVDYITKQVKHSPDGDFSRLANEGNKEALYNNLAKFYDTASSDEEIESPADIMADINKKFEALKAERVISSKQSDNLAIRDIDEETEARKHDDDALRNQTQPFKEFVTNLETEPSADIHLPIESGPDLSPYEKVQAAKAQLSQFGTTLSELPGKAKDKLLSFRDSLLDVGQGINERFGVKLEDLPNTRPVDLIGFQESLHEKLASSVPGKFTQQLASTPKAARLVAKALWKKRFNNDMSGFEEYSKYIKDNNLAQDPDLPASDVYENAMARKPSLDGAPSIKGIMDAFKYGYAEEEAAKEAEKKRRDEKYPLGATFLSAAPDADERLRSTVRWLRGEDTPDPSNFISDSARQFRRNVDYVKSIPKRVTSTVKAVPGAIEDAAGYVAGEAQYTKDYWADTGHRTIDAAGRYTNVATDKIDTVAAKTKDYSVGKVRDIKYKTKKGLRDWYHKRPSGEDDPYRKVQKFAPGGALNLEDLLKKERLREDLLKEEQPVNDEWGHLSYKYAADAVMADESAKTKQLREDQRDKANKHKNEMRLLGNDRLAAKAFMYGDNTNMKDYLEPSVGEEGSPIQPVDKHGFHDIKINGKVLGGKAALEYYGNTEHMAKAQASTLSGNEEGHEAVKQAADEREAKAAFFGNFDPSKKIPDNLDLGGDRRYAEALVSIDSLIALKKEGMSGVKGITNRRSKQKELDRLVTQKQLTEEALVVLSEGKRPEMAMYDINQAVTVGDRKKSLKQEYDAKELTKKEYKAKLKELKSFSNNDDDTLYRLPDQRVSLGTTALAIGRDAKNKLTTKEFEDFQKVNKFEKMNAFMASPELYQKFMDETDPKKKKEFRDELAVMTKKSSAYRDLFSPEKDTRSSAKDIIREFLKTYNPEKKSGTKYFGEGILSRNSFRQAATVVQQRAADGGRIFGEGGPMADKTRALVSPGEFVVREKSAKRLGYATLAYMNQSGNIPKFKFGGAPDPFGAASSNSPAFMNDTASSSLSSVSPTLKVEDKILTAELSSDATVDVTPTVLKVEPTVLEVADTVLTAELTPGSTVDVTPTVLEVADTVLTATIDPSSIEGMISGIATTLSNIKIETVGGAVGADALDRFEAAYNRIPSTVVEEVKKQVAEIIPEPVVDSSGLQDQVNNLTTLISSAITTMNNAVASQAQKILETDYKASMALNSRNIV